VETDRKVMPLTPEQGFEIRESHSGEKELAVCKAHGLVQKGGSRTKIDGYSETERKSIKNASGGSTQVHLTTQKHFIRSLEITDAAAQFIALFCGGPDFNFKGRDRMFIPEIDSEVVDAFREFLSAHKSEIIDLIVSNGCGITSVVYRDITNGVEYELTLDEIMRRAGEAEWKFMRGGIHLKYKGKTLFHLQREGKRSRSNRYNVLWHIHRNLFQ
jgi:hypothetical protein